MKTRQIFLIILTVLAIGTTMSFAAFQYYPYVFPEGYCFARNGVAVGDSATCRDVGPMQLEEIPVPRAGREKNGGFAVLPAILPI